MRLWAAMHSWDEGVRRLDRQRRKNALEQMQMTTGGKKRVKGKDGRALFYNSKAIYNIAIIWNKRYHQRATDIVKCERDFVSVSFRYDRQGYNFYSIHMPNSTTSDSLYFDILSDLK